MNQAHALTLDQIGRIAPSVMAVSAHASRSSQYTFIPTSEIIRGMGDAGFFPFKVSQSRTRDESRREFTKHMIRFRHANAMQMASVGDSVPEIVLINSSDGTSAYKLMAGLFRLVCENGMVIADSMLASVKVMHKGNIVRDVIEGSLAITGQTEKALESVKQWSNLQLTTGDQSAFAEAAHVLRFADAEGKVSTPITAAQLLQSRRFQDNGSDLWRTMNRVQENVIRGGLRGFSLENGRRRMSTTREVRGIDQDVRLNKALWTLAQAMADHKTA